MRVINQLHVALIVFILGVLGTKSFLSVCNDYDYTTNKLPILLKKFNLTTYIIDPGFLAREAAFPTLPAYIQGAFVKLTDMISVANSLNFIAALGFFLFVRWLFNRRLSIIWLTTGFLATPIFIPHLITGYIDLWNNIFISMAVLSLFQILNGDQRKILFVIAPLALLISIYSKYQSWPVAMLFIPIYVYQCLKNLKLSYYSIILSVGTMIAAAYWPLRNLFLFQNPLYPFRPPFIHRWVPSSSILEDTSEIIRLQTHPIYENWFQSFKYFFSFFEWSRLLDLSHEFIWTLDGWQVGEVENVNFRMGGISPIMSHLMIVGLIIAIRKGLFNRNSTLLIVSIIGFISVLPQSNEIRYYMFIPLTLLVLLMVSLEKWQLTFKKIAFGIIFLNMVFSLRETKKFDFKYQSIESLAPKEARDFWKSEWKTSEKKPKCIEAPLHKALFWAGPKLNSIWVTRCDQLRENP